MNIYKKLSSFIFFSTLLLSCNAQDTSKVCEKRIAELMGQNETLINKIDSLNNRPKTQTSKNEINQFSHDILSSIINFQDKKYTIFVVDPAKFEIELFNFNESTNKFYNFNSIRKTLMERQKKMLMVMNAGMYKPDRTPQGLYINNGVEYYGVDTVKHNKKGNFFDLPPNGIFTLDFNNHAQVITTNNFRNLDSATVSTIKLATQSGPMLLINNVMNTYFQKGSKNLNIRNGVGVNNNGEIIFIISNERVNFYEFAELYRFFGCSNALYLDGAISKMAVPAFSVSSNSSFEGSLPSSNHLGPIITVFK
ncbi:phosphodiester glycosidase family protein [Chitinophagales bacterium]|nr:phosphodiester glycosidase family protein [Chitinophagales bacterium]